MLLPFTSFDNAFIDQFQQLHRGLENNFGYFPERTDIRMPARGGFPPINIATTAEKVDVYLFVTGLEADAIEISVQNNILSVSATRVEKELEKGHFHLRERSQGKFNRVFTLPENVDPDSVEARYTEGVLHISVQRHEAVKPRQIKVQ